MGDQQTIQDQLARVHNEVRRILGSEPTTEFALGIAQAQPDQQLAAVIAWLRSIPSGIGARALTERIQNYRESP